MIRKTVSQSPIYVRDTLTRAGRMASVQDFEGAVNALCPVICKHPEVPMLFDRIREYELNKLKYQSGGTKFLGNFCGFFKFLVIKAVSVSDPVKAMAMCETSLAFCVDNPLILGALAAASDAADAPWGSATALKVLCKLHPNPIRMKKLAEAMQRNGQGIDALKVHQELISKAVY